MRNSVCQSEARGEMTKAPIALQELRRRIYRKAKSEKAHRFWGIFVHVTRKETLEEAYRISAQRHGAHLHRRRTPFVAGMRNDCDLPRDQRAHRVVADPPVGGLPIGKRLPVRWAIGLDLSAIDVREQVGSFEV